ncbi:hypothetical protein D9M68_887920 [compost metagenome]
MRGLYTDVVITITLHNAVFIDMLEQYRTFLSGMLFGEIAHFLVRKIAQAFVALIAYMLWYNIFHICCQRIVTFRIGKYVEVRYIQVMQELECFFKQFIRLAREAYNHIYANTAVRH